MSHRVTRMGHICLIDRFCAPRAAGKSVDHPLTGDQAPRAEQTDSLDFEASATRRTGSIDWKNQPEWMSCHETKMSQNGTNIHRGTWYLRGSDVTSTDRGAGQGSATGGAGALRASLTGAAIGAEAGHGLRTAAPAVAGLQASFQRHRANPQPASLRVLRCA